MSCRGDDTRASPAREGEAPAEPRTEGRVLHGRARLLPSREPRGESCTGGRGSCRAANRGASPAREGEAPAEPRTWNTLTHRPALRLGRSLALPNLDKEHNMNFRTTL